MKPFQILRILVFISSLVGYILCFVALVVPYWISITTGGYSGHQGLFISCLDNYGDNECSSSLFSNGKGNPKVYQVCLCMGFAFYSIFVMLAAMIFFWTRNANVNKGIKFSASAFALLTVVFLIVTVATFVGNHRDDSSTLSFGWYLAVVSLILAGIASPFYAVDAYTTTKVKEQISKSLNVAPRPTVITEYQRQRMIDGFNSQMYKQRSELPAPLGLRKNMFKLYDNLEGDHPPPRAVTPAGSDVDEMEVMNVKINQTPMLIPASSEYNYESMYDDENFVHPPPKLISADVSVKDIFKKHLKANLGYESDTPSMPSTYSLESGQLDDNDLEIFLITKGYRSNNGSEDERPQSREAFGDKKRHKKKHKVTPKIIDGRTVTKIEHEGLPTITVIGPDLESHDYKDPINLTRSTTLPQKEEEIVLPSEAESETNRPERSRKKSSSARSRRRQKHQDNEAFAKSDDEINYGAPSPCFGQGRIDKDQPTSNVIKGDEQEKAKHKKKSGKHKKRKRRLSHDNRDKEETTATKTEDKQTNDSKLVTIDTEDSSTKQKNNKRARSSDKRVKDEPVGEATMVMKEEDKTENDSNVLKRSDKKRSSKHKKHQLDKSKEFVHAEDDLHSSMTTETEKHEEHSPNDGKMLDINEEKQSKKTKKHTRDTSKDVNVEIEDDVQRQLSSKKNKHKRDKSIEQKSEAGNVYEGGDQLSASRRHSRKRKKHKKEKKDNMHNENAEKPGVDRQRRRSSKPKYRSTPNMGSDLEYDRVSGYGSDIGDESRRNVSYEKQDMSKSDETRTCSAENIRNDIDEILKIPFNSANENTKR